MRRARQELDVSIASVGHLVDVVGRTSERLLAADFAAEFVVAVAALLDERLTHKRLAPSADMFQIKLLHAEEQKAARGNLVGPETLLCFQLLLYLTQVSLQLCSWLEQWLFLES